MPLLCTCLFFLLLLPLSLSCNSSKSQIQLISDFEAVLKQDLIDARISVKLLLQNSSCHTATQNRHNCASKPRNFSNMLGELNCIMDRIGLNHTRALTVSLKHSTGCLCSQSKPTVRRQTTGRRRNEAKKLCRVDVIMMKIDECYQILSSILANS